MLLRPVKDTEEDADTVRRLTVAAFSDPRTLQGQAPEPTSAARAARAHDKVRHLAHHDPGGSWIAEDATGQALGAAQSAVREGTWGLALLAVLPGTQGQGVGTALLRRTLEYGRGCLRGLICCSPHPHAVRVYRRAGFEAHPTMVMRGAINRSRLGAPDGPAVAGSARDQDLLDSIDRRVRGGAHGPDHAFLMRHFRLVVADDLAGSGYCYIAETGRVEMLAATSRRLATRVLTAALLGLGAGVVAEVRDLTAGQQWALDVGLAASLDVRAEGFLCVRGMPPPSPFLPSGAFL